MPEKYTRTLNKITSSKRKYKAKFNKLNCSPNPEREHDFSCYTDEHLLKMRIIGIQDILI
jgi:hypothetical protein